MLPKSFALFEQLLKLGRLRRDPLGCAVVVAISWRTLSRSTAILSSSSVAERLSCMSLLKAPK
jgi:hypothetical protein